MLNFWASTFPSIIFRNHITARSPLAFICYHRFANMAGYHVQNSAEKWISSANLILRNKEVTVKWGCFQIVHVIVCRTLSYPQCIQSYQSAHHWWSYQIIMQNSPWLMSHRMTQHSHTTLQVLHWYVHTDYHCNPWDNGYNTLPTRLNNSTIFINKMKCSFW